MQTDFYASLAVPINSIKLSYCWVGGSSETFTEFGGKPGNLKHDHHIVPRAFGGKDGPTVSLCDSHHNVAHFLALRLEASKQYQDLLTGDNKQDRRLLWLASIICNAKAWSKDDPNKPIPIMFIVRGDTKQKLRKLKRATRLTYQQILELGLTSLYNRHFQK